MHRALAHTCSAVGVGLCIWEMFPHTHRRGACTQIYLSIYLMWLCFFELIQYPTEVNRRWVKPTHGSTNLHEHIFVSEAGYCSQQTAAFSLSPFVFFSMNTLHMLFLSEVFSCNDTHLCKCSAPEEANGKQWGPMVLSTLLGSLLNQPHKLCSLFLLSASSPVCITLAPALQR